MIKTSRNGLGGLQARIVISFVIFTGIIITLQVLLLVLFILIVVLPRNNLQPDEFKQVFTNFLSQYRWIGFLIIGSLLSFLIHKILGRRQDQSFVDLVQFDFSSEHDRYDANGTSFLPQKVYWHKDLQISTENKRVTKAGDEIEISTSEFEILRILAENIGETVTKEYLLTTIMGENNSGNFTHLRNLVHELRKKIEPDPQNPVHVINSGFVGYIMPKEGIDPDYNNWTKWE